MDIKAMIEAILSTMIIIMFGALIIVGIFYFPLITVILILTLLTIGMLVLEFLDDYEGE